MNRLSLRNINQLKFKTAAGKLPFVLEEFIEYYTPIYERKTEGCQHVTGWTYIQTLGSLPVMMPKNVPDHRTTYTSVVSAMSGNNRRLISCDEPVEVET